MIAITPALQVGLDELRFTFSRSGGPGGQNVNKVNTRVTLWFDVAASPSLDDEQKARILERLAGRGNRDGLLQVVAMRHRTQRANREEAVQRFAVLLAGALSRRAPRKKTRTPKAVREKRLREKKQRAERKLTRKKILGKG